MPGKYFFFMLLAALSMAGCSSTVVRDTQPARTATEQLLISTAADRAAGQLILKLRKGSKVFLDTRYVDTAAPDIKYAASIIGNALLQQGYRLVFKRDDAEKVVEIRLGALSINDVQRRYLGTPGFSFPVPLAGPIGIPEFNFIAKHEQEGLAKISASVYDAKNGSWEDSVLPVYGFSRLTRWIVFIFSWTSSDLMPAGLEVK